MGRGHDVSNQGAGRFCRETGEVGKAPDSERCSNGRSARQTRQAEAESEKQGQRKGRDAGGEQSSSCGQQQLNDPESSEPAESPARCFVHGCRDDAARHVPGSKATTVCPRTWFNSSFRFLRKLGGSFSKFLRSFHRRPATSSQLKSTAKLWPMPLPFPGALLETGDDCETRALQRGLNLCVAALDWVYLNRPVTCPLDIVIPSSLNRLQWRVVRCMESACLAWIRCAPVDSTAMGRSAAKVEDIEKALEKLSVFEGQIFSVFEQSLADNSGFCSFRRPVSKMAPGLQRSSPGLVCGTLPAWTVGLVAM